MIKLEPTVFEHTYLSFIKDIRKRGYMEIKDVIDLIVMLQQYEMDCHIVIAGQNGVGKSHMLLIILKLFLGDKWFDNLILARHTTSDIVNFILQHNKTICGIDELNQYLGYKEHSYEEQNHLIKSFELGRSKAIGFIGCVRDPRKVTLNYRDGKVSIVIWRF